LEPILRHQAAVRERLEDFLASADGGWQADFLGRLKPFGGGGKLLRGCLVCFSCEAFSGKPAGKDVLDAAAALELTHSALLIHDDIMDEDELRRGQASMHRQYELQAAQDKLADPEHYGVSMALGGGDLALFLALDLLAAAPEAVRRLFTKQLAVTCAGQMQDIYLESRPDMPPKQDIMDLMARKTASYSFALPLMMGAAFAGQPPATIRTLQAFGTAAGTIFQIRDDELGVLGDTRATGKPVGSDIREGKKTLLASYLLEHGSEEERRKLGGIFGDPGAGGQEIRYVQQLVKKHKITELLNADVTRQAWDAEAIIDTADVPKQARKTLVELLKYCSSRQS
jgi:geranylgeranyl pyrophosphate synthase